MPTIQQGIRSAIERIEKANKPGQLTPAQLRKVHEALCVLRAAGARAVMTQKQLVALRDATDRAIGAVEKKGRKGSVNWADLSCKQAAWVVTDEGNAYAEVTI